MTIRSLVNIINAALIALTICTKAETTDKEAERCQVSEYSLGFRLNSRHESEFNWQEYSGTTTSKAPRISIEERAVMNYIPESVHINYSLPKGAWAGMQYWIGVRGLPKYYGNNSCEHNRNDCGDETCDDDATWDGLTFYAHGDGRLRVQITEGDTFCWVSDVRKKGYKDCANIGETYEYIIDLANTQSEYVLAWKDFKLRKDWQITAKDIKRLRGEGVLARKAAKLFNKRFDKKLHTLALEFLCQDDDKECEKGEDREIELSSMRFYRGPNGPFDHYMFKEKEDAMKKGLEEHKDAGVQDGR